MQGQTRVSNVVVCGCTSWKPEHVWQCLYLHLHRMLCSTAFINQHSLQVAVYKPGSVKGLSTLRPKEEKPAELSDAAKARQKYLDQMYGGGSAAADPGAKPKRKRKRPGSASLQGGVKVGLAVQRMSQVHTRLSPPWQCH